MTKQSLEYSRSIKATFGNYLMLDYLDKAIERGEIDMKLYTKIHKILGKITFNFSALNDIKNKSAKRHAAALFKDHYINQVDINFPYNIEGIDRIKTTIKNYITAKYRICLK